MIVTETSQDARESFDNWLKTVSAELDSDHATDPAALWDLQKRFMAEFGRWRMSWRYGLAGQGTGPETRLP